MTKLIEIPNWFNQIIYFYAAIISFMFRDYYSLNQLPPVCISGGLQLNKFSVDILKTNKCGVLYCVNSATFYEVPKGD